jgi:ATP-dependent protease ClpP protease subunit
MEISHTSDKMKNTCNENKNGNEKISSVIKFKKNELVPYYKSDHKRKYKKKQKKQKKQKLHKKYNKDDEDDSEDDEDAEDEDSDENSDEEGGVEIGGDLKNMLKKMMNPLNILKKTDLFGDSGKSVYAIDNHIYFRCNVTMKTIDLLVNIINTKNSELLNLEKKKNICTIVPKPLYLHITSNGGSLLDCMIAIDTIINSRIEIHTVVDGYAMSAGSLMSVVGKKRYITRHSYILIHQLSSSAHGTFENLKDDHVNNIKLMEDMKNIYLEKTKLTKRKITDLLKHDILFDCNKCLENGLVDEIYNL